MREFFVIAFLATIGWLIYTDSKAEAVKPERYEYKRVLSYGFSGKISELDELGAQGYRIVGVGHTSSGVIVQIMMERKY